MTKMKRSQLKALIKECLVEILREDVLLQHATSGAVTEMHQHRAQLLPQQMQRQQVVPSEFINPMDDQAMVLRQQAMMQRNQLQRQSNTMNRHQQQSNVSNMSIAAGLEEGSEHNGGQNRSDTGVRNPSDYLRLAVDRPERFDPRLDGNVPRSQRRQQLAVHPTAQRHQQHQLPEQLPDNRVPEYSPDVLRSIFDDQSTRQTMQEQAARGHVHHGRVDDSMNGSTMAGVAGDRFDMVTSQHDPEELFPDSAGRWANLAF